MEVLGKLLLLYAFMIVSAVWARYKVSAATPGWQRLSLAAPIIVGNVLVPLTFDSEADFTLYVCNLLLLVWLANFKLLALACNRGTLSKSLSMPQFAILYALPITLQTSGDRKMPRVKSNSRLDQSAGSSGQLAVKWVMKLILLLCVVYLLATKSDRWPVLVRELAQAFMLYWFLGVLMDGPAAVIGWLFAMPISPHFDAPYLSSSMSEFWSKRWNLTVGNTLRSLCYDPVHEGRLLQSEKGYERSEARSAVAVCWTFISSGLMHELLIWYIDPRAATGEWLLYFTLQGPLLLAEAYLKQWSRRKGYKVVKPIKIFVTLLTQLLLAHWLFFPPSVRNNLDDRFFNDVGKNVNRFWGATLYKPTA